MRCPSFFARRHLVAAAASLLAGAPAVAAPVAAAAPAAKLLRAEKPVAGEYLVVLKARPSARLAAAEVSSYHASFETLAARHSAAITSRYTAALVGFAARMSEADARALSEDASVAFVEENPVVTASAVTQLTAPWGLDRIDQRALPLDQKFTQVDQGEGAIVYIIDTGIHPTHSEFTGRLLPGFTSIMDGMGTADCQGHGTHVAGTVAGTQYGVAKRAKLVPVRTLDCNGMGTAQTAIDGIEFMVSKATPRSVGNMSLGGGTSAALDAAVLGAIDAGYVMVVAAGNDNRDACLGSPARVPQAITVGATAVNDTRSTFSNWGTCVDLSAPGTAITSAGILSDTAARTISGTSMATPHVAGAAAAYRSANPSATVAQVTAAILAKAHRDRILDPMGSPNLLLNVHAADATPPKVTILSPRNGAEVGGGFTIELNVSEANVESVTVRIDGEELETRTEGPFLFRAKDVSAGQRHIEVMVQDLGGQAAIALADVTVADGGCSAGGGGAAAPLLLLIAGLARRLGGRRRR
jgi:subtilisin family serine protease